MKYRYFRNDTSNTRYRFADGVAEWSPMDEEKWSFTLFNMADMLTPEMWGPNPLPVEYFPDTEEPGPTYRYFRRGSGEWKVQTTDPDSAEGNFYRNADTPWLSASQSLNDLLANGATEVRASEEQVPRWAVAAAFRKSCGQLALHLLVTEADTEAEAIDIFKEDLLKAWPGALIQQPITIQVS